MWACVEKSRLAWGVAWWRTAATGRSVYASRGCSCRFATACWCRGEPPRWQRRARSERRKTSETTRAGDNDAGCGQSAGRGCEKGDSEKKTPTKANQDKPYDVRALITRVRARVRMQDGTIVNEGRRHDAQTSNSREREKDPTKVREGRGMEKQKSLSLLLCTACQSVGKQSQQAILLLHKGVPPGRSSRIGNAHPCFPSNHRQPPPEKEWSATAGRTVWRVGGWSIEDRGWTNQRPGGPHLELDTKGSLTRSSKSTRADRQRERASIRRRGNEKGGCSGPPLTTDRSTD